MKFNRVRIVLIICNILFILVGVGLFAFFAPALNQLVLNDARQAINNHTNYIIDALTNDDPKDIKYNYGLTVYVLPRDGNRKPRADMFTFYIVKEDGQLIYTSNPLYKYDGDYRKYLYIDLAFQNRDTDGETTGVTGNEVHYTATKITVDGKRYLLVYDIDKTKIQRDVYTLLFLFMFAYLLGVAFVLGLSIYIDRQYSIILKHQQDIIDAYLLLDDPGASPDSYIERIKKVLHSFSFTTAALFALNKTGQTIFRNRSALSIQVKLFGQSELLPEQPINESWMTYREYWVRATTKLFATNEIYEEWITEVYSYENKVFFFKNRIKKIIVDNEPILICEVQDITDITLAHEAIDRYTKYLETIFNSVHDVIIIADLIGTIKDANYALDAMFGYNIAELRGMNIEKIIKPNCTIINDRQMICDGIRADGTLIKCQIYQNYLKLPYEDKMQLLVVQDVTQQELLKSQVYASIALTTETMKTLAGNV